MKRNIYETPVMMLRSFGVEDVVCASKEPQADPHFVKGNDAPTAGSMTYTEVKAAMGN